MPTDRRAQRGAAIVMAVVVFAALLIFGLAAVRMTVSSSQNTLAGNDDREAMGLAEAGLSEAMDLIRTGGSGQMGSLNLPVSMGEGLFWVDAVDLGNNRSQLVATGMLGSGRVALEAIVERPFDDSPLFETVINSNKGLSMASGTFSDSFESSIGSYGPQAVNVHSGVLYAGTEGSLRSNSSISVGGIVLGDATPGPGSSVSTSASAYVHGSVAPADSPFAFPPIVFPAIPQGPALEVPANGSATLPAGDHGFANLILRDDATLRIEGPATILVDSFAGMNDARLEIDARLGPVEFFCRGDYAQAAGFEAVAVAGSPMALAFKIDGQAKFGVGAVIRGGIYAPNTNITLPSGSEVFGALAADAFKMASGVRFHYDEDLADYFQDDTGQDADGPVTLLAWFEREVNPPDVRMDRRDPFEVLGILRANCLTIAAARRVALDLEATQKVAGQ